jgi:sugar phosphate isomerase/epimerase
MTSNQLREQPSNEFGIGFETIQFAGKFRGPQVAAAELITAAREAGFGWMAIDRHTLAAAGRSAGGLEELARACSEAGLPCRSVHSLRITGESSETAEGIRNLARQIKVLRPDVVPLILLTEPTRPVLQTVRAAVAQASEGWPHVRFGLEFGPVFPVADLLSARRMVHDIAAPGVGLLVDSWHVFNGTTPLADLATLDGTEVALVQLNDHGPLAGASVHEAKDRRLLPGDGRFPLQRFLDLLWAAGYRGLISVEVISSELRADGPGRFAQRAFASLAALRYGPGALAGAPGESPVTHPGKSNLNL